MLLPDNSKNNERMEWADAMGCFCCLFLDSVLQKPLRYADRMGCRLMTGVLSTVVMICLWNAFKIKHGLFLYGNTSVNSPMNH
jgi:hypothetical protein